MKLRREIRNGKTRIIMKVSFSGEDKRQEVADYIMGQIGYEREEKEKNE